MQRFSPITRSVLHMAVNGTLMNDCGLFLADLGSWHTNRRYLIFIQIIKGAAFPSPIAINNRAELVS